MVNAAIQTAIEQPVRGWLPGQVPNINADGFLLLVPASEMKCLCAGQYAIGGVYELNGETISLFTGTISVIDGVARL